MIDIKVCKDYEIPEKKVAYAERYDSDEWDVAEENQLPPHSIILRCWKCGAPATVVDHLWPHMSEHNRCDEHKR